MPIEQVQRVPCRQRGTAVAPRAAHIQISRQVNKRFAMQSLARCHPAIVAAAPAGISDSAPRDHEPPGPMHLAIGVLACAEGTAIRAIGLRAT